MSSNHDLSTAFVDGRAELRVKPDIRYRVIDQEALVLRQETAEVLGLNPVGTRILEAISDGMQAPELVTLLEGEFEVERPRLQEDVRAFVADLLARELLEVVPQTEP